MGWVTNAVSDSTVTRTVAGAWEVSAAWFSGYEAEALRVGVEGPAGFSRCSYQGCCMGVPVGSFLAVSSVCDVTLHSLRQEPQFRNLRDPP